MLQTTTITEATSISDIPAFNYLEVIYQIHFENMKNKEINYWTHEGIG